MVEMEKTIKGNKDDLETLHLAKKYGFNGPTIAALWNEKADQVRDLRKKHGIIPVYKMVDTCAAEFESRIPYFYSTHDGENESHKSGRKPAVIIDSGPTRIGQGVEFDYAAVRCVKVLQRVGHETIVINSNPETVLTDFSISDKLYFESLTLENVLNVCDLEKPGGVIVQFGGQTSISPAVGLERHGVKILGTTVKDLSRVEDRELFDRIVEKLKLNQPKGLTATTHEGVVKAAEELGYPVLVRPSYVFGGRAMEIVYNKSKLEEYLHDHVDIAADHPILVGDYLDGRECDVDAICDGKDVLLPGIMEHIEHAGVHSGGSMAVYPPRAFTGDVKEKIMDVTRKLALTPGCVGIMNTQFIVRNDEVYVIEANPRASRTVPFLSKITGIEMA